MNAGLSIIGLIISTGGTLWLVGLDIHERSKKAERTREVAKIKNRLDALKRSVEACRRSLSNAFHASGDPRFDVEKAGEEYKPEIEELQRELDAMEDINPKVLEDLLPIAHPIAFGLIAIGFVVQMFGVAQ